MKKIIISILVIIAVIILGLFAFRVFQKPPLPQPAGQSTLPISEQQQPPIGKCGDNVCDEFEKANPNACPADCKVKNNEQLNQCPQYVSAAPSFYTNCEKQGGKVEAGEKDNNGCQSPPRCVVSETSNGEPSGGETVNKNSPFGMLPFFSIYQTNSSAAPNESDFKETKDLGLKWGRAHYLVWPIVQPKEKIKEEIYDWSNPDAILKSYPQGFNAVENIVAFLGPSKDASLENQTDFFVFPSKEDESAYVRFIKKAVERYDGDGKDDMPGLKSPIKYWQVENEPDLVKGMVWRGYANLLKITYEAIKSSCSDCKVMIGGMAGGMKGLNEFFKPAIDSLGGKYFDIFDYHCYGDKNGWLSCGRLSKEIRNTFPNQKFEIWFSETGTWSGSMREEIQTEKEQAESIVKYYVYSLSIGIKKIFWAWGIVEGFERDCTFTLFEYTGLVYDGADCVNGKYTYGNNVGYDKGKGVKKLSYYTYKKMVEVLEGSDWDNIQTIQEAGGVYIYKFTKNSKPIWVAWNDNSSEKQITISGITSNQVKITETVSKYESGKEVKDYDTAFNEYTKTTEGGKISLTLKDRPVFVEE